MATRTVTCLLALSLPVLSVPAAHADLYVANSNSNNLTVSIGRPACGFFSGIVPAGVRPTNVAVSPDGTRAYVANMGDGTLSVVNTALPAVTNTVPIGGSPYGPIDAVVHPDGSRIYAASNNRVAVVNAASLTVVANIFVAGFSNDVAIHPDGSRVYVATVAGLSVIDTATNTLLTTVPLGTSLRSVVVHPDGTRLYVAHFVAPGSVTVLDAATLNVITSVPVAGVPEGMAVHPSGARLYVANNMNVGGVPTPGKLTVIDTGAHAVLVVQDVYANPWGVAIDRNNVYVTTADGGGSQGYVGHLWVFDAATSAFVDVVEVGGIPAGVATFLNPSPPPLPPNVQVTGMEVTQGIQDLANSVELVAGRRTLVRVHVKTDGPTVPNVTATLFGQRILCTTTSCEGALLGSLMPANTVGPRIRVKSNPQRKNVDDSFLFELPWAWTNVEPLRLYAVMHTDPGPPPPTCQPNAPFSTHGFEIPTTLRIQFVRLAYSIAGTTVEATVAEQNQSESWIRRTYPVTNLVSGPDRQMFYAGLGSRVDRSAEECQDMDAEDRSLCAQRYITPRLAMANVLAGIPGNADGAYGLLPQHGSGPCTPAADGTMPCFTRGACCTSGVGTGPSNDPDYAAHEIGHLLGRQHPVAGAGACGHDGVDAAYPYTLSLIHPIPYDDATGFAGFDIGDPLLSITRSVLNTFKGPYDVMGYCSPSWISDYTYRSLYGALRGINGTATGLSLRSRDPGVKARPGAAPKATAGETGDWLMVFGSITPGLPTPAVMEVRRVNRVARVPSRTPGSHSIRLIGAGGGTLADYSFAPEPFADATPIGEASSPSSFGHVVPFVDGTTEVRIVNVSGGDAVLAAKAISANAPVIGNVALQGPPDPVTGAVTVGWTATDPDGDPLTFDVFFTRDGDASLQPLLLGLTGTSVEVDTARLGGGLAQFRVMATDGVLSAFADTAPFTLAPKPPRPRILTPGGGATIHLGQLVNLEGEATDAQDGLILGTGLVWSIPGRSLGSGSRLSIADLPAGVNPVTLTATNSLGLAATAHIVVVVRNEPGPPGPTLTVGPRRIGWHVAAGESQLQTAELDIGNSGGGDLEFTAESSASWLTLSAAAGTAPTTLTLTADPAGLGGGVTAEATVAVTAVGIAGQAITVPVTLSVGNTFVVGSANPGTLDLCPDDPDKNQPGACGCGVPDTEAGEACTTAWPGVCAAGVTACAGGTASCVQTVQPSPEVCDGLDNDCDGETDEGTRRRWRALRDRPGRAPRCGN